MAHQQLANRLNNSGYKNWLKAGQCLLVLAGGIAPYIEHEIRSFHEYVLNQNTQLQRRCHSGCSSKGKLSFLCPLCSEWSKVILRYHRQPNVSTVNWDNCSPALWSQDHWELAKAYMPKGAYKKSALHQCDASALLNLLNFCNWFRVDPQLVREVICCRNELMHSGEMCMDDGWMERYRGALLRLLRHLHHQVVPLDEAVQQIEEIFTVDWSTCITGSDQMDGADDDNGLQVDSVSQSDTMALSVSQLEAELLGERLRELLQDTETQDAECLLRLREFLQANTDLRERFSLELQAFRPQEAAAMSS
ncbi:unnamed protein product [Gadus morhua 'NCC']